MTVLLPPILGAAAAGASDADARGAGRAAPAVPVLCVRWLCCFFRDDAALVRADWAITCAYLQVARLAESETKAMPDLRRERQDQTAAAAVVATSTKSP